MPRKQRLKTIFKLAKILYQNKIDIIHTHCPSPDFYGKVAAYMSRVPLRFSTIHSTAGYLYRNEKILGHLTTKYIAISKQVKKYMVNNLHIPNRKIRLIFNGIDIEKFKKLSILRKDKLTELGICSDKKIITNIGRVTEKKGQFYLIQAAKIIVKEFPNTHFLIVGNDKDDEKLAQKLKQIVKAENLNNYISFTGVRQDISEILSISDVFTLSSIYEGFALVVLEAMAVGLPVVATAVGIIPEIIINKENGLIVPPKDINALANGIEFILEDEDRAKKMGLRGVKVAKKFTIEKTVSEYEKLYLSYFYNQ